MPGEGLSILHVVCPLAIPRGVPGEGLSILHVVCPLVTPRGVPWKGLSVLHVVCPLVNPKRGARKWLVHPACCLSPNYPERGARGRLRLFFWDPDIILSLFNSPALFHYFALDPNIFHYVAVFLFCI